MPADIDVTLPLPGLSPVAGKPIIARFDGGSLSSNGGLLALREVEARLGVAQRLAACIDDPRAPERIHHGLAEMLRFRLLSNGADAPIKPQTLQPTSPAIRTKKPPAAPAGIKRDQVSPQAPDAHRSRAPTCLMNYAG